MEPLLRVDGVVVQRSSRNILGPITWHINEGERWVILGPNGAGKTTLLQLLAALTHPSQGRVTILGESMGAVDVFELRPRIGFTSSAMLELLPHDERVMDIVLTSAYAIAGRWQEEYDLWDESRAKALLTTFGVRDLGERIFGTLSEGEKKRVQISRALMADPEVLLLDEPTHGLDPLQILSWRELLLTLRPGRTIMLSSHVISDIAAICDRLLVIYNGVLLADKKLEDLRADVGTSSDQLEAWIVNLMRGSSVEGSHVGA